MEHKLSSDRKQNPYTINKIYKKVTGSPADWADALPTHLLRIFELKSLLVEAFVSGFV